MIKDNLDFNQSVKPNTEFLEQLQQKLPDFFTSSDSDVEAKFDMEKFQKALEEHNVEELSSGFQLDFIGKNYAKKQSGERPTTIIVPDNEHNNKLENKDSKNLFFTGDNLEVLRHLQQNYTSSIDLIYIDPPYNTGSDGFVYPDKFEYSDEQLQDMFNLNDDELRRMKSIQGKSTHSAWLTFMYPRLYLAKKLLKDTGIIFISIDDNEQSNLKLLMDDVFGEAGFAGLFIWKRTDTPANLSKKIKQSTEYIEVYQKRIVEKFSGLKKISKSSNGLMNQTNTFHKLVFPPFKVDTGLKDGIYKKGSYGTKSYIINLLEDTEVKDGIFIREVSLEGKFKWSQSNLDNEIRLGTKISIRTEAFSPSYEREEYDAETPPSLIDRSVGVETNEDAQSYLTSLFDGKTIFSSPKPTSLIKYLLNFVPNKEAIILDFFAGSSTTADAVLQLNAEDGGYRKYIMVQLPEATKINSNAYEAGYTSIDQFSRTRIEKVAAKIKSNDSFFVQEQDLGFKHYYIVEPSKKTLDKLEFANEMQLDIFDDMISAFSSENLDVEGNAEGFDTILQTYLVSDGYKFDVSVETLDFAGVELPYVNDQRIYLITNDWTAQNTKALVNAIGKNEISVQTIVVYGYTIDMESLRELEIALNQLENKVHLLVRY